METKTLTDQDLGQWFTYVDGTGEEERGKLKAYDNERRVAWIVYKANGNWDGDHWKDYTAAATSYDDIKELQAPECGNCGRPATVSIGEDFNRCDRCKDL